MINTTLNDIRKHSPCREGWTKLLAHLGKTSADDELVSFEIILKSNGIDDALWCLRALPSQCEPSIRLLTCDLANSALKFVPDGEDRPRKAIEAARKYANGAASCIELASARDAAWYAARDAARDAAWYAARAAAWAARAAARAAWYAARDAARDAAWDTAWTARAAARDAARKEQKTIFLNWLEQRGKVIQVA